MRTNKEQLDIIIERKSVLDKKRRTRRKIGVSMLSLLLCFAIAIGCVVAFDLNRADDDPQDTIKEESIPNNTPTEAPNKTPNADGVIAGNPSASDTRYDGVCEEKEDGVLDAPLSSPIYGGVTGEGDSEPTTDGVIDRLQAGTLTGGEIIDADIYDEWLQLLDDMGWGSLQQTWRIYTNKRVSVKGAPYSRVQLLNASGDAVKTAVTNYKGEAFLFLSEQEAYQSVALTANSQVYKLDRNEKHEYVFEVPQDTKQDAIKLDLMFVIDTTGSMGDELVYLNTEMVNVIDRISKNDISVRTSVNFYRDEGDEYVVKYHGFKDSTEEVQSILSQERAQGGGDTPEAVHTALDNAINEHDWQSDSVKVMFLVLDAPPHDNSEVAESLSASITKASEMGIRIIPVASSGIDKTTEFILRSIALTTNGSYAFLTNHSGIGNPHIDPTTDSEYDIERLNDMLVRIALQQCGIETEKKPISVNQQQQQQ